MSDEIERAFHWSTKAWYAQHLEPREPHIMFGLCARHGGTTGEMKMTWHALAGRLVPRLEAFSDSWPALAGFPDLIASLGELGGCDITEAQFVEILKSHGFADFTAYEKPREEAP